MNDLTGSHIDEMQKIQEELKKFEEKYVNLDKTKNIVISDLKKDYQDVYEKLEKNENEIIELQNFLKETEVVNSEQMNNFSKIENNHVLKINELNSNFEIELQELKMVLLYEKNTMIDEKNSEISNIEKELNSCKEMLNNAELKIIEMKEELLNDSIPLQEEMRSKYENQVNELESIITEKNEKLLLYDILINDYENLKIESNECESQRNELRSYMDEKNASLDTLINDYEILKNEKYELSKILEQYENDFMMLKEACDVKDIHIENFNKEIVELNDNIDKQNIITKEINHKLNININEIQDRIIENVSLREDIKNANLQLVDLEKCFNRSEQNVISLNTRLTETEKENNVNYNNILNEKNIVLEEVEYYKSSYTSMEIKLNENSAQFMVLNNDNKNFQFNEIEYLKRLEVAESAGEGRGRGSWSLYSCVY